MKQIMAVYCEESHNTVPFQYCRSHYNNICFGTGGSVQYVGHGHDLF